jgi:uncharacterized membrane protein
MRLTIIAACGLLLVGCSESATTNRNDATRSEEAEANEHPSTAAPAENLAEEATNVVSSGDVSACLIQDGEQLRVTPVRAIGTEPFWNAQVEGRCVTYSTPEDQKGTRIWTRFNPGPDGGVWIGSFEGKSFKLITRLRQGCSDGMSDRSYPLDALLSVRGEERTGCAEPDRTGKR